MAVVKFSELKAQITVNGAAKTPLMTKLADGTNLVVKSIQTKQNGDGNKPHFLAVCDKGTYEIPGAIAKQLSEAFTKVKKGDEIEIVVGHTKGGALQLG